MALTVKIPVADVELPKADALSHSFRSHGGTNRMVGDEVVFPFDNTGEMLFSPEAYALVNDCNWVAEGGMFYHIFLVGDIDLPVPIAWPESTVTDQEGIESTLTFQEYFNPTSQYPLADGTTLCRIVKGTNGLNDADRKTYQADLGVLLTKGEGVPLIPVTEASA